MAGKLAILRSQVESALAGRISAPFSYRDRKLMETVSAGIPEIDSLAGGFPRGGLTEICGPPCSGRTSLLISALAERTAHAEVCALVDGLDTFDPHSAEAAGVELKKLLWVRCRNINQAFRATDLLIQGGGFGLIALDLSDVPAQTVRYIPLNAWFRFRRAVEDTPTILIVLEQEPNAKTCSSLVLQLGNEPALWSTTAETTSRDPSGHPSACLLDGGEVRAEVLRSRMQANEPLLELGRTGTSAEHFALADNVRGFIKGVEAELSREASTLPTTKSGAHALVLAPLHASAGIFKTKSLWSLSGGTAAAFKQK